MLLNHAQLYVFQFPRFALSIFLYELLVLEMTLSLEIFSPEKWDISDNSYSNMIFSYDVQCA